MPSVCLMLDGQQHVAILVGAPALPNGVEATTVASTNNSRLLMFRIGGEAQLPTAPAVTVNDGDFVLPQINATNELISQGETAYNQNCSVCHGPMAVSLRPDTYPDLRFSRRLETDDTWTAVVLDGELRDAGMVSFSEILEDGDAEAIRAFVINQANLFAQ